MGNQSEYRAAIKTIERFIESLHDIDSPFEFATTLVKATAQNYKADIATLFRVSPSKTELNAEAVYDEKGQQLKARASYRLDWNAREESDMKHGGLTAWVAVSGKPLFVKNAEELLNDHPAHKGAWDYDLHPDDPKKTFGCLYAVPLRIFGKGGKNLSSQESVLGVYKIERRKDNPEGIFTPRQINEFDLAAKQISLVILLYERAMSRVLSDARHAVAGRLADAINQLDMLQFYLDPTKKMPVKDESERLNIVHRVMDDSNRVNSWLRQSLQVYSNPTDSERRTLKQFIDDTIEARTNQHYDVKTEIWRKDQEKHLHLTVAQSWDLHTLLLSLINNAIQHSGEPETVSLKAEISSPDGSSMGDRVTRYIFTVEDHGKGIPDNIMAVSNEKVPQPLVALSGTGLKRVFRVAKYREWKVEHEKLSPGSRFTVTAYAQEVK